MNKLIAVFLLAVVAVCLAAPAPEPEPQPELKTEIEAALSIEEEGKDSNIEKRSVFLYPEDSFYRSLYPTIEYPARYYDPALGRYISYPLNYPSSRLVYPSSRYIVL